MKGLYLCSPHGLLIWEGKKTAIVVAKPLPLSGHRVICSKEDGEGLAFGIALIGDPALLDVTSFSSREEEHCVPRTCRLKWWPDATHLYHYPILQFQPFPDPVSIQVSPGTTMDMGEVELEVKAVPFLGELLEVGEAPDPHPAPAGKGRSGPGLALMSNSPNLPLTLPAGENHLVTSPNPATIMSTTKEVAMPWTASDAREHTKKADTPAKQKRWAAVANDALSRCEGDTKTCEASAIRQANSVIAGMKTLEEEIEQMVADKVLSTVKMVLGEIETKAGDMGDGEQGKTCTCPNCGFEAEGEAGTPCRNQECPKCGAKLQGGDGDDNQSDETPEDSQPASNDEEKAPPSNPDEKEPPAEDGNPAPQEEGDPDGEPEPGMEAEETTQPEAEPTQEDPSGTITSFVIEKLRAIYTALGELFKRETYQEKEPSLDALYLSKGFKTLGTDKQGRTWFALWPTNAYVDREGEAFATKALHDFVNRHAHQQVKGEAWYEHTNGSKFGTIWEQAVVADHFICQLGTYDPTPVGQAFKAFFSKYPDSHPTLAPHGWGASHQYDYIWLDRQDSVYEFFDIHESTVLPLHKAANVYNPQPLLGGMKMKDEQKTAFAEIGNEVGVPDLVDQIVAAGTQAKEALDARQVERKSKGTEEPTEEVTQGESQEKPSQEVPPTVASLAEMAKSTTPEQEPTPDVSPETPNTEVVSQVVEALQLDELSKVMDGYKAAIDSLSDQVAAIQSTLAEVTRSEEVKKAEIATTIPRMAWMRASQAQETLLDPERAKSLSQRASDPVPAAVKGIASSINA